MFYSVLLLAISINGLHLLPINDTQMTNGNEADLHQFPWHVSLKVNFINNYTINCSGTLLSEYWIVTAAQCVRDMVNVTLGFGSNDWNRPTKTVISDTAFIYEEKNRHFIPENHDIALIKMNKSIILKSDNIKPILLPGRDQMGLSFGGVKGTSTGWDLSNGPQCKNSLENHNLSKDNATCINWAEMNVIMNDECKKIYDSSITDNKLCARSLSNSKICENDFGGSLVILEREGWKIIGVTSYTDNCTSTRPVIYSRITKYMQWISNTTGIKLEIY